MTKFFEHPLRKEVEKSWQNMPFPNRKMEEWKYVNTDLLNDMKFDREQQSPSESSLKPEDISSISSPRLVILDGKLDLEKSDFSSLEGKIKVTHGSELPNEQQQKIITQAKKQAKDDYAALYNIARANDIVHVSLERNIVIEEPLNIVVYSSEENQQTLEHLYLDLGSCSQLSIVTRYLNKQNPSRRNCEWTGNLQAGAQLKMVCLQNESQESLHLSGYNFNCERDSHLELHLLAEGSRLVRHRVNVDLLGENAEASLSGAALLKNNNTLHHHLSINHLVPHCRSHQLFKNILKDKSRSSFDGTVYVEKDAQLTEADQLNKNLVLSKDARASTKPQLKIYADDVVCAHGATIGQLEEEEVFYLKTRGISDQNARDILSYGFIRDAVDQIPFEDIKKEWSENILLKQFNFKGTPS